MEKWGVRNCKLSQFHEISVCVCGTEQKSTPFLAKEQSTLFSDLVNQREKPFSEILITLFRIMSKKCSCLFFLNLLFLAKYNTNVTSDYMMNMLVPKRTVKVAVDDYPYTSVTSLLYIRCPVKLKYSRPLSAI